MKTRLISLLTTAAVAASLAVFPVSAEAPLASLPDEPAPIVIEKEEFNLPEDLTPAADLPEDAQPLPPAEPVQALEALEPVALFSARSARVQSVADEISVDGKAVGTVYFTLDEVGGTAALIRADQGVDGMLVVPRTFTHEEVEYTVTSIGSAAFAGQKGLTQLWLPDTITEIGYEAFMDCEQLKAVGTYDDKGDSDPYALPKSITDVGVRTFRGCTRLNSVTIPAAVERIDAWAFAYCYSLGRNYKDSSGVTYGVYFADGSRLSSIHQGAFYYCISLENITLPQGLESISLHAFYNCASQGSNGTLYGLKKLVIPSSVTEIGEQAFAYCGALKTLTIPAGIETLPSKTFYACSALETVDFTGDGLRTMGDSVFFWCTKLKTVRTAGKAGLPATLTAIPRWAFYRCDSLADLDLSGATALRTIEPYAFNESGVVTLTLPQNLKTIGLLAFEGCSKLKTINWNRPENDEDLLEIGEKAFAKAGLTKVTVPQLMDGNSNGLEMFYDCDSLTKVDCEPNARFIPGGAFRDCDNLTTVSLGQNIHTVGQQAFYSCPKLSSVNLSSASKLAVIKPLAFCRTALTTVSLPASIREIGLNAFGINRSLVSIDVPEGKPGGYYSVDGVLYQENQNNGGSVLLVRYPAGKAGTFFAVPEGVTAIESYAFSHSEKLEEVTFPDSLRVIGYYALSHCINLRTANVPAGVEQGEEIFEGSYHVVQVTLPPDIVKLTSSSFPVNSKVTSVTLPATVAEIDVISPFSSLSLLREIQVDAQNPNFKSVDGVLFSKDGKTLYAYPPAKATSEYVVPDGVTAIWYAAFSGAKNLEHLVFPASVETVHPSACQDLPSLSWLDIYRENIQMTANPNETGYHKFLGSCAQNVEVYLTGDPYDSGIAQTFYSICRTATENDTSTVKLHNIHVGYFKSPAKAGDRFVDNGLIYTLTDAKTVKVGDNTHYQGSQVTIPAQVSHEGVTYTVSSVDSGAFAGTSLTAATVMLPAAKVDVNAFDSGVTLLTRSDLTALTPGETDLAYGGVLPVNTPAGVAENATVTLTANGKSLTATVKGGVALFPVNRAMVDAFGFGEVAVSAGGGGAQGQFTLKLSPKALTIDHLPQYNTSLKYFLIEKPYDGTSLLDYTEKAGLKNFTLAGDDLALHVTGTLPVEPSNTLLGNGSSGTQLSLELTGSAAKYYTLDDGLLPQVRVEVTKGQLYIKELGGVLQQPTFYRAWAAEDGLRVKDCSLGGGSFIAYLPTVENNVITGYTQVDVKGTITYTDENHYPAFSSFDEIGVEQDRVYHWAFIPEGNGDLQNVLSKYTFSGTVKLWDTSLTKGKDPDQGKAGENPALPAYVLQFQADNAPIRPTGTLGTAAATPTSKPAAPSKPSTPSNSGNSSGGGGTSSGGGSSSGGSSSGGSTGGTSKTTPASTPAAVPEEAPTTVAAAPTPVSKLFHDVSPNNWYCDAIQYVCDKGMMNGMGENSFAPDAATTRGTIVTMLYRLEAQPSVPSPAFRDVAEGQWYALGVSWAASTGLVNGFEDGAFRPETPITREQVVTILYRYAAQKGCDVSAKADLSRYSDANQISPYALTAMSWAAGSGVLQGQDWGGLDPAGSTTRAQLATILMRFCETVLK